MDLGDPRREARLLATADAMAKSPERSFPEALTPAELEGGYRFFNNPRVEPDAVLAGHVRQTLGRMRGSAVNLVLHDSSTISFNSDGYREGLVRSGNKQQFVFHASLAVRSDGSRTPDGVLVASYHVPVKTSQHLHQDRWAEHVRQVHALGVETGSVVHVMDREADDYELLDLMVSRNCRFVVRVQHNRILQDDQRLRECLGGVRVFAERDVQLSRRSGNGTGPKQRKIHPPREGRIARLAVSATQVTLRRSDTASKTTSPALALHVIRVWEPCPPDGQAPVEWLLYTTEAIDTVKQILQVVDWYRARWTIEEYFKALKTGCAMERRQLGDLHALTNAARRVVAAVQVRLDRSLEPVRCYRASFAATCFDRWREKL